MLIRSSFRDRISKLKKENLSKDKIHLIKYDSIDNLFLSNDNTHTSSQFNLSNRKYFLTKHYSSYTG